MHSDVKDTEKDLVRPRLFDYVYGFEYDCYLGAYGCATKLKAIPADGQHHGCPFKHSKKLNGQLSHWGVKKEV